MTTVFSFTTDKRTDSVFEGLTRSGGELTMTDLVGMLDMCQIATCHERGERYLRQAGHYVERGGVLRINDADSGQLHVIDDLEQLRVLILRRDPALDIASKPHLRPARE
jgi:hypothetical protein